MYAEIPLHWDEAMGLLAIGDRWGRSPGMLQTRTFHIVFVGKNHGVGVSPTWMPEKRVVYTGKRLNISLK